MTYDKEKIIDELNKNYEELKQLDYEKDQISIKENKCVATIKSLFKFVFINKVVRRWLRYGNDTYLKLRYVQESDGAGYYIHVVYTGEMKEKTKKISIFSLPTIKCVRKKNEKYAYGTGWIYESDGIPNKVAKAYLEDRLVEAEPPKE